MCHWSIVVPQNSYVKLDKLTESYEMCCDGVFLSAPAEVCVILELSHSGKLFLKIL